jgi:hypothetical protein
MSVVVGVDTAPKLDSSAVVGVQWVGTRLELVCHRIWHPSPDAPLDYEATLEAYLRALHARVRVLRYLIDPYQMHRSIMTLKAVGLPVEEFPQTSANTTRMGQVLFDLLTGRNLRLYPADDLRAQAMNTVAIESTRGWRIAKERASRKIDGIVALAMACVGAIDYSHRGTGASVKIEWSYNGIRLLPAPVAPGPPAPPPPRGQKWSRLLWDE